MAAGIVSTFTPEGGSAITFQVWNGYILGRTKIADVYHRLGANGAGVQSLGLRAKPTTCRAIALYADISSATTAVTNLNLSRAGFATVVDGLGVTNRCIVHDVDAIVVAAAHAYGGESFPYRVEATLVLEYVGLPQSQPASTP